MRLRNVLLAALCGLPLGAAADQAIPTITTDELKRMVDAKESFILANALSPIEFAEEHIAGSVNIPYDALRNGIVKLPQERTKLIVFYCKGPKCTKSSKAAGLAVKMGHANVAVYHEGLPEWVKRGYPAELRTIYPRVDIAAVSAADLKRMLDAKEGLVVVDIRDDDDQAAGRIAGSRSIDLEVLDRRVSELAGAKRIVLVDLHGKQSQIAGRFLASKGLRDVLRLDGGFVGGWVKAGYPIAR
jgi:rhodanese-related sulfurtransferase